MARLWFLCFSLFRPKPGKDERGKHPMHENYDLDLLMEDRKSVV